MKDITGPVPPTLDWIPLQELTLSPLNTRQTYTDQEVDEMASSIGTTGLIQNLSGLRTADGVQVVAGGKRLAALRLLADRGSPIDTVPVRVTDDEVIARNWSMVENTARSRPHPADEIRAFRKMFEATGDVDTIARSFAEHPDHVKRRLKLASLSEDVLDALKANQINLQAAQQLTLARSAEEQAHLLKGLATGSIRPEHLRGALQLDRVPSHDRRAKFVGLERYMAEGGKVTEDLFDGDSLLHDERLLDKLFKAKLKDEAEAIRALEEWSWATPIFDDYLGWGHYEKLEVLHRTPGDLPDADFERLEQLDELEHDGTLDEAGRAELEALDRRQKGDFSDADRATGGIFVLVDRDGDLVVKRAYRRPADKAKATKDGTLDAGLAALSDDRVERDAKPAITQSMQDDLHCIARRALQSAVVAKFELVLDLLAFQLETNAPAYSSPFNIQVTPERIAPEKDHGMQDDPRLAAADAWERTWSQTPAEKLAAFTAFREKGKSHRNQVLAQGLVRSLQLPQSGMKDLGKLIAEEAGMKIRRHWTPGAEFFKSARPDVLDAWWVELLGLEDGDERIEEFGKLKKGKKVEELAALFSDLGVREAHGLSREQNAAIDAWLPPQLEVWG